ncbi:hypothetical protein HK104_005731, partial [Borealophlyctis nickersoniae]
AELTLLGTSHDNAHVMGYHPPTGLTGWVPVDVVTLDDFGTTTTATVTTSATVTSPIGTTVGGYQSIAATVASMPATTSAALLNGFGGDAVLGPGGLYSPKMEPLSPAMSHGSQGSVSSVGSGYPASASPALTTSTNGSPGIAQMNDFFTDESLIAQQHQLNNNNSRTGIPRSTSSTSTLSDESQQRKGGGKAKRTPRDRKVWDHNYEARRKEKGTRGHGANFRDKQRPRFPIGDGSNSITYAGVVEHLLKVLEDEGGKQVVFTPEAVKAAQARVQSYDKKNWRIWIPNNVWSKFLDLKISCVPTTPNQQAQHHVFLELLLDLGGYDANGQVLGVQRNLLAERSSPAGLAFDTELQWLSDPLSPPEFSEVGSDSTASPPMFPEYADFPALAPASEPNSLAGFFQNFAPGGPADSFLNDLLASECSPNMLDQQQQQQPVVDYQSQPYMPTPPFTPITSTVSVPSHYANAAKPYAHAPQPGMLPTTLRSRPEADHYPSPPQPPPADLPEPLGRSQSTSSIMARKTGMARAAAKIGHRPSMGGLAARPGPYVRSAASGDAGEQQQQQQQDTQPQQTPTSPPSTGTDASPLKPQSLSGKLSSTTLAARAAAKKTQAADAARRTVTSTKSLPRGFGSAIKKGGVAAPPPAVKAEPKKDRMDQKDVDQKVQKALDAWKRDCDVTHIISLLHTTPTSTPQLLHSLLAPFTVPSAPPTHPVILRTATLLTWLLRKKLVDEDEVVYEVGKVVSEAEEEEGAVEVLIRACVGGGVEVGRVFEVFEDEVQEGEGDGVNGLVKGVEGLKV